MIKRIFWLAVFVMTASLSAKETIRITTGCNLSPDGKTIAFAWRGDLWSVPATGGVAKRLTSHSATDAQPKFSPDGKRIAFISSRNGGDNVYVMSATGGAPTQATFHSEGYSLEGWYPDGRSVLTNASRDH